MVLTTLVLMLRCVETICVSVRERPRAGERVGYLLSVHNNSGHNSERSKVCNYFQEMHSESSSRQLS